MNLRQKKLIQRLVIIILCFISFFNPSDDVFAITPLTDSEVWLKINSTSPPLVIDVRSNQTYIGGHIPTSINLPMLNDENHGVNQSVIDTIISYNRDEIITICSCANGGNARAFVEELSKYDLNNLYYMSNSFLYWPYEIVNGNAPGTITSKVSNIVDISGHTSTNPNVEPLILIFDVLLVLGIGFSLYKRKK